MEMTTMSIGPIKHRRNGETVRWKFLHNNTTKNKNDKRAKEQVYSLHGVSRTAIIAEK